MGGCLYSLANLDSLVLVCSFIDLSFLEISGPCAVDKSVPLVVRGGSLSIRTPEVQPDERLIVIHHI